MPSISFRRGGQVENKSCRIPAPSGVILLNMSDTDLGLLVCYTRHHAEDAFTALVRRHLAFVYCAALRQVRSRQLAEEVAQSAFLNLAHHAHQLVRGGDAS